MKITQEPTKPAPFSPITIVLESRAECAALAAVIGPTCDSQVVAEARKGLYGVHSDYDLKAATTAHYPMFRVLQKAAGGT